MSLLGSLLSPLSLSLSCCLTIAQSRPLSSLLSTSATLSLLPCQARVRTKTRLGLWLGRLGAGNPRLPNAHLLICEGATVGGWQGVVELRTANGSSSSVPAAVGPGTHRQGWGTSESVSLPASQPVGTVHPCVVLCSAIPACVLYSCVRVCCCSLLLPATPSRPGTGLGPRYSGGYRLH